MMRKAGALAMLAALAGFLVWLYLLQRNDPFDSAHETARGEILDGRVVVAGQMESNFGGRILYQMELRVLFNQDGKPQERWLQAVFPYGHDAMVERLRHRPKACEVFWTPGHPENAKCRFYKDFQ